MQWGGAWKLCTMKPKHVQKFLCGWNGKARVKCAAHVLVFFIPQSGDERIAIERRAREVAEDRLRRVMQEAEAR